MNLDWWRSTFGLGGRVVVVTGGGSGIGFGCAEFLSMAGAKVALWDINAEKGEEAAGKIGGDTLFVKCDVSSNDSCRDAARLTVERFGSVWGLLNAAGVIRRKNAVELEERDWDIVLDVGLKGAYLAAKHLIPEMEKAGSGSIVNIGSGWGIKGGPKAVAYCASKGGIVNMTRAMAIDHGPGNIKVNCVCPGDVDTPLLRDEARQLGYDLDKWLEESADRPIHRLGTPLDIAKAVYFFMSDLSPWASGSILAIDGGGTA
ncbi:MAG: SDR family oxidoreductase [Synergistaceae bacterium]|jgi:NAD(P)-dependent dehydrogenase (short-subunit alcohol dehydrogenase family)|nr:SDR family oxidoreductase [Synergistaceae bacterium]